MDMMVTGLEPFPKGKGRVAVYLNDKFAFVLYKGELSDYGLEEGIHVDDVLYERILSETLIPRAKKRGMNLLKTMDRTEYDVRHKLSEGGYPQEAVDAAISYLKSYRYIDDMRYASEYIRFKSSSMSRKQIHTRLSAKGIGREVTEAAFAEHDAEARDDDGTSEKELIRKLILKKHPSGCADLTFDEKQKLYAYLYRKGFPVSLIDEVVSGDGVSGSF
ncbi:MAG: recombination regulator RecX [Lachnospiraceae bacterium]|nr:recombination regulator RecX [Lachnospiraceae bacterium]